MRRVPFVAGNWKMNKDFAESMALVDALRDRLAALQGVEVVLCPPFIALSGAAERLRGGRLGLGAQNMHWAERGAYTGEVSALMLKPLVRYVILGHSERRQYFGETDDTVNQKVRAALQHGLTPILCVGENLKQYEAAETASFVEQQVRAALRGVPAEGAKQIVVAYEPIWAIGTGKAASGAGANSVIGLTIRGALAELYGEDCAQAVRVVYGGSITAANMGEFMRQPEIDGGLVGGASLNADEFAGIVEAARPR